MRFFNSQEEAAVQFIRSPAFLPELRRRMNLAINENCDLRCYIPTKEYDDVVRLAEVDLGMIDQLELLPPETVIERLTGDGEKSTLLAPLWSLDKRSVLGGIMKRQKQLDSIQGMCFREV